MLEARLTQERVPAVYTVIAPFHDLLARLVEARARALALDKASVHSGIDLLEVAVGTGLSFRHLVAANPEGTNVGIDRTPAMLRKARRRMRTCDARSFELLVGDAYDLPFENNSFDLLVNSYMFDMLPESDFEPVLREFRRVIRPGGRLILLNMAEGTRWYHRPWTWIYQLHPYLLGGCRGVAVSPHVERAGFENVGRTFVSQRTFPSEVIEADVPVN